jgi:hypothetical protein
MDKLSSAMQRRQLDLIQQLNHSHLQRSEDDAQIDGLVQSYEYSGRDFRLTDVYGRVVHDILA